MLSVAIPLHNPKEYPITLPIYPPPSSSLHPQQQADLPNAVLSCSPGGVHNVDFPNFDTSFRPRHLPANSNDIRRVGASHVERRTPATRCRHRTTELDEIAYCGPH